MLYFAKLLSDNRRPEIHDGVETAVARWQAGELYTSVDMPPRFGKGAVIRLCALEFNHLTDLPFVMMAPWTDNADQIKEVDKVEGTFKAYGVPLSTRFVAHRVSKLKTHQWWQLSDRPTLLTCTIPLISNVANQKQFLDGIADMRQRLGKLVPIATDECHLIKIAEPWGDFLAEITEAGGYLVVLTGTAVPGIPGFENNYGNWKEAISKIYRKKLVKDELKHVLETHEGRTREINSIQADVRVKWRKAWDVGALAKVNPIWIDIEVIDKETGEPLGKLSQMPEAELSGRLKSIMESDKLMALQVAVALNRLQQKRSKESMRGTQVLVVTGADEFDGGEKDIDRHARRFKKMIDTEATRLGMNLRIEIATGNNERSADLIKQFRHGKIDVLIVKNMGLVGMDRAELKIEIWGSSLRQGPLALQGLTRALTTPWGCPADLILPMDCRMVKTYNAMVKDQGGEYRQTELHLVNEVEVEPPDEKPIWIVNEPRVDSYGDEYGNITRGDYELELSLIKQKYDTNGLNDRQIIDNFIRGAFPITEADKEQKRQAQEQAEASGIRDLDDNISEDKFGLRAREIVNAHIPYYLNKPLWLQKITQLQGVAKQLCNVHCEVTSIDDPAILKQLLAALEQAEISVFGNVKAQRQQAS